jgi:hypothetical protein
MSKSLWGRAACLLGAALLLSGCFEKTEQQVIPPAIKAPVLTQKPKVVYEPQPDTSPEKMRALHYAADGSLSQVRITYRPRSSSYGFRLEQLYMVPNGSATVKLRADASWESAQLYSSGGQKLAEFAYAPDGHTVIGGYRLREDGSQLFQVARSDDGSFVTRRYWPEGKLAIEETTAADGSIWVVFHVRRSNPWV